MLPKIFKKIDDAHEFKPLLVEIEQKPAAPLGRMIFWLIVFLLAFFILWLWFGKVDIVVTGRGKLVPAGNIKMIQPISNGVVSKILIKEGDFVKKGQVLIEIDPSTTLPELKFLEEKLVKLEVESSRLEAIITHKKFRPNKTKKDLIQTQTQLYTATLQAFKKQLEIKKLELGKTKAKSQTVEAKIKNVTELLKIAQNKEARLVYVSDIIAMEEMEKAYLERIAYTYNLEELAHDKQGLWLAQKQVLAEMLYLKAAFNKEILKEYSDTLNEDLQLKSKIEESTFINAKQRIVAPEAGYINEIFIYTEGGVVSGGQKLMTLVPKEAPLIVKVDILNKDIGFIKIGMPVSVKIDTFNFQKYGLIEGKVIYISKDSIEKEKIGIVYNVDIEPGKLGLKVDGKKTVLQPGMTLSAEVNIGERRIIEFFIYPLVKYLDEGMSVR
ncbi:HlyD family type I secretion periplasmic adaptor subunit [bacterium]|nr:HlyD family type I secretion periplasmic adaptor subunit [bacterium]MBT3580981.1 HlyD family type I secretion periplasmic adaptor subunit [bacterium]MBT4551987.1 HlyD family type I secretion periplasmic adaptor subunit [bacterium]MBT5988433.1 HlyD family type I secretion periplasmic adaptor subunit [bacterium]MBT7087774.1 HlyD family type I secretion periplasmic adaptor subunit [bacterium]